MYMYICVCVDMSVERLPLVLELRTHVAAEDEPTEYLT